MGVRNYPDIPRVYFDMDGVLADFEAGARRQGMAPKHYKRVAGAYLDLPLVPGAGEALETLHAAGFLLFALTKIPSQNPYAATEKLLWAQRYAPILGDHIIVSPDKGAVGTARDFLIDDHPEWANAHNFPGTVIHFKNNWSEVCAQLLAAPGRAA